MHAPLNNCFVTIEKKFHDSTTFESGITLYHDTTFHPEEHAMLRGQIVSLPTGVQIRADYEGMTLDGLQPGDDILMRYDVVFAYSDQPDRSTPLYKNMLWLDGEEYWRVDIQKIFAVVRDGMYHMLNGYVMVEQYIEERSHSFLIIPKAYRKIPAATIMVIRHIGEPAAGLRPVALKAGDRIVCMPGVAQPYRINDDKFWILKQSHIVGKYTYS